MFLQVGLVNIMRRSYQYDFSVLHLSINASVSKVNYPHFSPKIHWCYNYQGLPIYLLLQHPLQGYLQVVGNKIQTTSPKVHPPQSDCIHKKNIIVRKLSHSL